MLRRPRDPAAAKKALAEAGYGGEKIVVIAPTELAGIRALSLIGANQMRRAGLKLSDTDRECLRSGQLTAQAMAALASSWPEDAPIEERFALAERTLAEFRGTPLAEPVVF